MQSSSIFNRTNEIMRNQKPSVWYLENINVQDMMCPKKIDGGMMESLKHRSFKKGDYIFMPNESADKVYFISKGRIKVGSYGESGKEITKAILTEGEVFGELALVGEEKRRDFAIAMDDCETCIMTKEEMKGMMKEHSSVSLFMMKVMGSRVLDMEKRLESLVFKDSRTRIIQYLEGLAEKKGQRVGYEMLVRKFLTHQEIANLTATSRQTVTTVLNELRTKNILTFNRQRLLIRDMEKLAAEAG